LIFFTNTKRKFGKANLPNDSNWHAEACFHADEEAMMAGLHHSLFRDDSDRFAVTIFVKFVRFVFVRKNDY